ncbi:Superkiller protein 3, partial [Coemansia nantahalensis]
MSVIFKAKLKAAKEAVGSKNYEYAYDLCHDLLELDANNYNVHILLGVSCQHLCKWREGESVYARAMRMPKANTLAWQGACALHEAEGDGEKYEAALVALRQRHLDDGNADRAWETAHKLIGLREAAGDQRRLVQMLRELARPEGPLHALLGATAADPAPPSLAELLERMVTIEAALDRKTVDSEISKRKSRIGAGPLAKVRQEVRDEVYAQSGLLDTLALLVALYAADSDAGALLRAEEQYLMALMERLDTIDDEAARAAAAEQLWRTAEHLAASGVCAAAFEYLIEVADEEDGGGGLADLVDKYTSSFPNARLTASGRVWAALAADQAPDGLAELAQEGLAAAPESPFAHAQVVRAAVRGREYRLAVKTAVAARSVVQQYGDMVGAAAAGSTQAIDMGAADAYMQIGPEHASDAERLYRDCVERAPGSVAARLGLGLALCELGESGEGEGILRGLLDTDPANHLALGGLGAVRLKSGDLAEAERLFRRAIDAESEHAAHHARLGDVLWRMGGEWQRDKQHAYASWIRAAQLNPKVAGVFCGLGKWYQQHGGDGERAKRCFAKAAALDSTDAEAGQRLADLYLAEGSDDLCEAHLVRATDASYAQPWAWRRLGFLHLRQGSFDKAAVALQNALSADRADRLCWEGLCEAYTGIGRMHTAVKVARKVVELTPDRVAGHWLCAQACLRACDAGAALGHFQRAADCLTAAAAGDSAEREQALWARPLAIARAECLVACAERWYVDGLYGRAADAANAALEAAQALLAGADAAAPPAYLVWGIVHAACMWLTRVGALFGRDPGLARRDVVRDLARHAQLRSGDPPRFLAETAELAAAEPRACGLHDGYLQQLYELAAHAGRARIPAATSAGLAAAAWADLGYAYFEHAARFLAVPLLDGGDGTADGAADGAADGQSLLDAAANCALAAVKLDAESARAHTLQGLVAAHQPQQAALAQHAFIMA